MNVTTRILDNYFKGKCSQKEYESLLEQLMKTDDPRTKQLLGQYWMDFKVGTETGDENMNNLLLKIQHRIYLEDNRKMKRIRFLSLVQRIAAILFVPLVLSFVAYIYLSSGSSKTGHSAWAEIRSPLSGKTHFVLPDGSDGYLNNGSVLKYSVPFEDHRVVSLKGEACFDVLHTGEPFHVLTSKLDVTVMGTKFNVEAYSDDYIEEIILKEGKVKVATKDGKELSALNPDQQFIMDTNTKKFWVKQVDASNYMAWTDGKLIFRNDRLDDVIKKLSRWYNVDFVIKDPELLNYTFHATFMDERLDEVLKLLSITTPITYREEKRAQSPEGGFEGRREIKLGLDQKRIDLFK